MALRAGAIVLALVLLAGCGGADHKTDTARDAKQQSAADAQQQPASRDRAGGEPDKGGEEQDKGGLSDLPLEDRRAFVQIGVASGHLRSGASLVLVKGFAPSHQRTTLLRLRKNVALLHPVDPRLRRLRVATLAALASGIRAPRAARSMLANANRIRQGLRQYSNANPAIGTIAPE